MPELGEVCAPWDEKTPDPLQSYVDITDLHPPKELEQAVARETEKRLQRRAAKHASSNSGYAPKGAYLSMRSKSHHTRNTNSTNSNSFSDKQHEYLLKYRTKHLPVLSPSPHLLN